MYHARVAFLEVDDYLSEGLESDIRHEYVSASPPLDKVYEDVPPTIAE